MVYRDRQRQLQRTDFLPMVRALDFAGRADGCSATTGHVGLGAQQFPGRMAGIAEVNVNGHSLAITFHGSIYNLNDVLPSDRKNTDNGTALLHLFLKDGTAFLRSLRGEFSLALWDGREESLYLAADRFRAQPLFYCNDRDKFLFASRMNSLFACPLPPERTLNEQAIVDIVASSIIPTPQTIFREVKKLPPGQYLVYRDGNVTVSPHWQVSFPDSHDARESELARRVRLHMEDAIAIRLKQEHDYKQVGTFLSGGVDSSTVTGLLARHVKDPIKSYSIGFGEHRFNEMNYARIAARAFGVEHHEYFVTPQDTYEALPVLLNYLDEPFANASLVPSYFCAKMAREFGTTVLYAGDGGDELFAGNERYATQRVFQYYNNIPGRIRNGFLTPLVFLMAERVGWSVFTKAKKYVQRASIPYDKRISSYDFFNVISPCDFLDAGLLEAVGREYNPYAAVTHYYSQAPAKTDLDRHLYIDWNLTLSDNDLIKVTRATECAGVTVRFPFLDPPLVEFSTTVPASIKMRRGRLRSFFKAAYSDLLPPEIRAKKKHGFGLPIPMWLRTDRALNELMHELVLSRTSLQRRYFRKEALGNLVAAHSQDQTSFYGTTLWNLMVLELWLRKYAA
jgi:asparagine synthase (glutamine-hydrolysing)